MNHLALIGPPHLATPRIQAAQRIHRIGHGIPAGPAVVSFDPADQRSCRDLLTWFERGGQRGTTLLIDDWNLCAATDPGLTESVRWIAATAPDVQVIITSTSEVPARLRRLFHVEALTSWHERNPYYKTAIGTDEQGGPVTLSIVYEEWSFDTDGKDAHFAIFAEQPELRAEALRSLTVGLMTSVPPLRLRMLFIDAHDTGVFTDLDQAPHSYDLITGVAENADLARRVLTAIGNEFVRRRCLLDRFGLIRVADYQKMWENAGPARGLEQLPRLLIHVNDVHDIFETHPDFANTIKAISLFGAKIGIHLVATGARKADLDHKTLRYHFLIEHEQQNWTLTPRGQTFTPVAQSATLPGMLPHTEAPHGDFLAKPLNFLALHGLREFTKSETWTYRSCGATLGSNGFGPVETSFAKEHRSLTGPPEKRTEAFRSALLSLMTTHSPSTLRIVLTAAHEGLDQAPHVQVVTDPEQLGQAVEALLPQAARVLVGVESKPEFEPVLAALTEKHTESGLRLFFDGPHELAAKPIDVTNLNLPADLAEMVRSLPRLMNRAIPAQDFFALHGMQFGFDKRHAWCQRPVVQEFETPLGTGEDGLPVQINFQPQFMGGMGPHGELVGPANHRPEAVRAMLLGEMVRHSPDLFQVVLVDVQGSGVFTGLEKAPHVYGSFTGLADAAHVERIVDAFSGEVARRQETLALGNYKNIWDYRKARSHGAPLDPMPQLLICFDGAADLVKTHPVAQKLFIYIGRFGRSIGTHLLLSDAIPMPDVQGLRSHMAYSLKSMGNAWSRRSGRSYDVFGVPADLDEMTRTLPQLMAEGEPDRQPMLQRPLWDAPSAQIHQFKVFPERNAMAVGLCDEAFEHRVTAEWAMFREGKHGAIVGKPGSGRTTALRTLAAALTRTFGSTDGYYLADGQLDGLPNDKHVIVTAETWDQVPQFIRDNMDWCVELKLADPAGSIVDERRQAILPDQPGLGLRRDKLMVKIAIS